MWPTESEALLMAKMRTQVSRRPGSLSCRKGLTLCGWGKGGQCGGRGFSCQLDSSTSKQTPCLTLHQLHSFFPAPDVEESSRRSLRFVGPQSRQAEVQCLQSSTCFRSSPQFGPQHCASWDSKWAPPRSLRPGFQCSSLPEARRSHTPHHSFPPLALPHTSVILGALS